MPKPLLLNFDQLVQQYVSLQRQDCIVEGYLQRSTITLLIGDSGLGKTALAMLLALCASMGRPFLGNRTAPLRVLVIDLENGVVPIVDLIQRLVHFLRIEDVPDCLLLATEATAENFPALIEEAQPDLVVVDSMTALDPFVEEKNSTARARLQEWKALARRFDCAIVFVHHIRKPSSKPGEGPASLEADGWRAWFRQARGASALINASDVRLGVDSARSSGAALVMRGFSRLAGEIPLLHLERVFDDDGEAIGYRALGGAELLEPENQRVAYKALPERFRFKDAQVIYEKGAQATTDFLNKCLGLGLLRKEGGRYLKTGEAE